jgi:hypothetical protein
MNILSMSKSVLRLAMALVPVMVSTNVMAMEFDIDRPGQDFRNFDLSSADPAACEYACRQDPNCRSWTYVKPNTIQGPNPRCWLKTGIPNPVSDTCCVSGVAAKPDDRRGRLSPQQCNCWFDGYDSYPQAQVPGGTRDECDLIGMMTEWTNGWNTHKGGGPKECP